MDDMDDINFDEMDASLVKETWERTETKEKGRSSKRGAKQTLTYKPKRKNPLYERRIGFSIGVPVGLSIGWILGVITHVLFVM